MALVDVLIPTCNRKTGLAVTLAGLFGQTFRDFNLFISDQTEDQDYLRDSELLTLLRAFKLRGITVKTFKHLPRRGMAEHRHFLLSQATAPYVHFLDDDVLLEPEVLERMLRVIQREGCGFVGCAAIGLSHLYDVRPHQHNIEIWEGPVKPEPFTWETLPWDRHKVNNAANALHLERKLIKDGVLNPSRGDLPVRYKVAWIGGANVLCDRQKLLKVGGFSWWAQLPKEHAGEEVLAQFLLICKFGGCGILPSGTYHLQLPTEVENREVNATSLFPRLVPDA